jgi:transcriptional regulator with XRE-family HTH domain
MAIASRKLRRDSTSGVEVRHYRWFSELVKALRRKHKLSQRDLASELRISPGYVGQWELRMSQPSPEVVIRLCRTFNIEDLEYVQRLAFASRAPDWLRESILSYEKSPNTPAALNPLEKRILDAVRRLAPRELERVTERVEGWVEAILTPEER